MLKRFSVNRLQTGIVRDEFHTKECSQDRQGVGHHKLAIIFRNANHKGDRNKSGEIEEPFSCTQAFDDAYYDQVKINAQHTKYSCKPEFMAVIAVNTLSLIHISEPTRL